ncbi:unnamed protein product, partial [Mesorhabditis belari]|uniref:Amino acid transporter transmembrane domain-containing protein n=1 Tax=Mesorhabditis belari TaxID=2138241 RepID=A0AAF3J7H0_9BILA
MNDVLKLQRLPVRLPNISQEQWDDYRGISVNFSYGGRLLSRLLNSWNPSEVSITVFVTYAMSIGIPHLDSMIPLVGVTSGTLCALVYPPLFEIITFWDEWKITIPVKRQSILLTPF